MAIGVGLAAGLVSAAAVAAEAVPPPPAATAVKIASARVMPTSKHSNAAVSARALRSAACQGAWCGRQVVLMLGIGY